MYGWMDGYVCIYIFMYINEHEYMISCIFIYTYMYMSTYIDKYFNLGEKTDSIEKDKALDIYDQLQVHKLYIYINTYKYVHVYIHMYIYVHIYICIMTYA
jgi:hypothetical protein